MGSQSWNGRNVLITGHTGFKGSWLTLYLEQLGARVSGYSLQPDPQSLFSQAELADVMNGRSCYGDLSDYGGLKSFMDEHRPDVIFHLAAQSLVRESYKNPLETYRTNVIGTANVLEAARYSGSAKAVVVVTSDKCYENRETLRPFRETDPLGGHDPYSSSKACAELVTSSYQRSFFSQGPNLASARAGNVIGGGDYAVDRLIPDIVRAFARGEIVEIRNPDAVRPWQHVLESLSGYVSLAEGLLSDRGQEFTGAWNFGPADDSNKTVRWLVDAMSGLWAGSAQWKATPDSGPHEATNLRLDSSRARTLLDWSGRLSLPVALEWTLDWYQAVQSGQHALELTRSQVQRYMENEAVG